MSDSDPRAAASRIRSTGRELGFTSIGFAPAEAPVHAGVYLDWLEAGYHGEMAWMARPDAVRRRLDPREALIGCRTVIVATLSYSPDDSSMPGPAPAENDRGQPLIARYARGIDYHDWFETRLDALADDVRSLDPDARVRRYVDYGPVLERDHAQRAGLGWIGKNSMLISPELGSWLLLGELLTTLDVEPDPPFVPDRCGTCRRCIDACPTDAILDDRTIDSRRCISYLTIELRGSIPVELRPAIGNRVFGCDICQDVCPWNAAPQPGDPTALVPGGHAEFPAMQEWAEALLEMDRDVYREAYRGTPLARPGRDAMLRNLCVGLGNSGDRAAVPVLRRCLADASELVREHAAWALERL
ncbi:MAG: tRNA epoxyqueuosine(34) reductase QueG [Gemmatimonadota bacterium]|nr:tRNA epoxyqueuosine(34) reductase QueG [Gemmatimonadota bacterium]MDH3428346.1 tRNA epoxyqueuosine(34) reductase QueG [Gemmatimonadota bacterium]